MRSTFTSTLLAVSASILAVSGAAHAQTTASYFLINFNDGTPASSYLFEYDFVGAATTEIAQIDALTAKVPGFTSKIGTDPAFGDYVIAFGYGGHSDYNDFESTTPLNQDGFWGSYTSPDGINWSFANFGPDQQPVSASAGSLYNAWVWEPGATDPTPSALPAKITADATAAPEPGALSLLLFGGFGINRRCAATPVTCPIDRRTPFTDGTATGCPR